MIPRSKTLVYPRNSYHAYKQASSPQKITAQNERYLNHITLVQPLEQDTYQATKITAQNERYLNHISECSISEYRYYAVVSKRSISLPDAFTSRE